jgi:hypothetical protein
LAPCKRRRQWITEASSLLIIAGTLAVFIVPVGDTMRRS